MEIKKSTMDEIQVSKPKMLLYFILIFLGEWAYLYFWSAILSP
jgi:hypothetical protein